MKLALIGYGKMGKAIEAESIKRGHTIGVTLDNEQDWMHRLDELRGCDMAVDFSTPDTAVSNIMRCFDLGLPIVVGTTGWYDQLESVVHDCRQRGQALFVASNFSIGMNIMFDLNRRLAALMNRYGDYDVSISETHHIHKLDAPSGTAASLAKIVGGEMGCEVPIESRRIGEVAGIHELTLESGCDKITLTHEAYSRKGFAEGAVSAALLTEGIEGVHEFKDIII